MKGWPPMAIDELVGGHPRDGLRPGGAPTAWC